MRFNSWDVLVRPVSVYHGIGFWAANPFEYRASVGFPAFFGLFLFISYLMLYALTHLRHAQPGPRPAAQPT